MAHKQVGTGGRDEVVAARQRSSAVGAWAGRGPARPAARPEKRQRWLVALAAVVVTAFIVRLVQVQVIDAHSLAAQATQNRTHHMELPAHRGDIVDTHGQVLATSVTRYTISADQFAILSFRGSGREDALGEPVADGAMGVAQLLAPALDMDRSELAAQLNGEGRYVVLARNVESSIQRDVRALGLQGFINIEPVSHRAYPAHTVAGTLLGFIDYAGVGQGGIERAFDEVLSGIPGQVTFERGRDGVAIAGGHSSTVEPVHGGDVILSINRDVQWFAQRAIDEQVEAYNAQWGIVIVMDNFTGQILAIADSGSPDPNDRSTAAVASGSRAVQYTFEPGSTGKLVTLAAALETGVVTPDTEFVAPFLGTTPNGQVIQESRNDGTRYLTAAGVFAVSSNTGTVQIAEQIPPAVQHDYLRAFGFGQPTGLNLPGESWGLVHDWENWDGRTRWTVTFGQAYTVNAMQMTAAYAAIANGGVRVDPVLIRGTRPAGSNSIIPQPAPENSVAGQRIVSEETAQILLNMMETAVSVPGSTGRRAQVPGFRVGGKTGTAQNWNPEIEDWELMQTFVGIAPLDNPRFTVSVFIKEADEWAAGLVAAPVFSEVMSFVLQSYGIAPSVPRDPDSLLDIFWGPDAP